MLERLNNEDWEEEMKNFYKQNAKLYAEVFLANEDNRELINEENRIRKEEFPDSTLI